MKRSFKKIFVPTVLVGTSLVVSACGGNAAKNSNTADTPKSTGPKILTMAMWSAPENFSPLNTNSNYGWAPIAFMFDSLVGITEKNDFVPRLATKWENNKEFTVFTFDLDPKAKWSDDKPVTADDVKWTIDTIANPKVQTNRGGLVNVFAGTDDNGKSQDGKVSGVKVLGPNKIEFTVKAPTDPLSFLENIGTWIYPLPKHVLENVAPEELTKHSFFQEPKVTNGAFKFVKYAADQYIEFDKNPAYHMGAPKLDKIVLKIVKQTSVVAALEKGEVDMTAGAGIGEVPISDWEKVKKMTNITTVEAAPKGMQYMNINYGFKPFQDKRVRQAMAYAINRPLIVQRLLQGAAEIWDNTYTSAFKYLDTSVKPLPYDLAKAKALLKEANFDLSTPIQLYVPTGNAVREQSGDIILQNLKEAGFNVKAEKIDFAAMQAKRRAGEFQLALVGWSSTYDPDTSQLIGTGAPYNSGKFTSKAIDDLLAKGKALAKFDERKKVYDEFQRVIQDEQPNVHLYAPKALLAFNKRLVNVAPSPNMFIGYNIHQWDIK